MDPNLLFNLYAARQDAALAAAMDQVLGALLGSLRQPLQFGLLVYVTVAGIAVAFGRMSGERYVSFFVRALAVSWLLTGTAAYASVVRDTLFTEIPNMIASAVTGRTSGISAAQQFDALAAAAENMVARIYVETTGWSVAKLGQRLSAEAAKAYQDFMLTIQFVVWMLSRRLMVLAICIGPPLVILELFEATRGYVRHWVGVLVGLLAFQLASAVQMQISLRGASEFILMMRDRPGAGLDAKVATLWDVGGWFLMDAVAMLCVPMICAVGSGVAMHHAAGSQAVTRLAGGAVRVAGGAIGRAGQGLNQIRQARGSRAALANG